jgi:hypothetical protein
MNTQIDRRAFIALATISTGCSVKFIEPLETTKINNKKTVVNFRPPAVGQTWIYNKFNCYNSQLLDTVKDEVVAVQENIRLARHSKNFSTLGDEIHSEWGRIKQDSYWDLTQNYETALTLWSSDLREGHQESFETYFFSDNSSFRYWLSGRISFIGWEKLRLPIGTFETMHFEKFIRLSQNDNLRSDTLRKDSTWIAPEIGRWVVRETNGEYRVPSGKFGSNRREDHFRWQLNSFS